MNLNGECQKDHSFRFKRPRLKFLFFIFQAWTLETGRIKQMKNSICYMKSARFLPFGGDTEGGLKRQKAKGAQMTND